MAADTDKVEVKEMIQSFFRFANVLPLWDGEMNEEVAAVFGIMLSETRKCSDAFGWLPVPPGGRASIAWLVMKLGRGVFNAYRNRLSFTCARAVIYKWRTRLDMASMGVGLARSHKWA